MKKNHIYNYYIKRLIIYCVIIIVLLVGIVPLVSSVDWPLMGKDSKGTRITSVDALDRFVTLWTQNPADQHLFGSPPISYNDKIFITTTSASNPLLVCLDATSGEYLWSEYLWENSYYCPAAAWGYIFVPSESRFTCYDAESGSMEWITDLEYHASSDVNIDGSTLASGKLVVSVVDKSDGTSQASLWCINPADGSIEWKTSETIEGILYNCSIDSNRVYVGCSNGKLYCFNLADGSLQWHVTVNTEVFFQPSVLNGFLYFSGANGYVYCYELHDHIGILHWVHQIGTGLGTATAIHQDTVFVASNTNTLYCLDAEGSDLTTTEHWMQTFTGSVSHPVLTHDGYVYLAQQDGPLYRFSIETGSSITYDEEQGFSSVVVDDHGIFASSQQHIVCIIENQLPPVPTPPTGETDGDVGDIITFSTIAVVDPDKDTVSHQFSWGDDSVGPWKTSPSDTHCWSSPGIYSIKVRSKDSYGGVSDWSTPSTLTITGQSIELPSLSLLVNPVITEKTSFTVVVTSEHQPLADATVTFSTMDGTTNEEGEVQFTAPEVDDNTIFLITASKEGYTQESVSVMIKHVEDTMVEGYFFGRVTTDQGVYLPGVTMCLKKRDTQTIQTCVTTDDEGMYLATVSPSSFHITASHPAYHSLTKTTTVAANEALEVNFILSEKEQLTDDSSLDALLENKASEGAIAAHIQVPQEHVTYFIEGVSVELSTSCEQVTCMVSAEEGTPGTILTFDITDFTTAEDITITYDGDPLEQTNELSTFFTDETQTQVYALVDGVIFVRIPHFSSHTIIISAVSTILGFIPMVSLYALCSIFLALGAFIIPIVSWKKHFKKVKEK